MKCIKLVRMEHGLLPELTTELINLLKGNFMEAGGAVMMFSATNLVGAGVAGYCADVMHSITTLRKELGEHLVYTPLPHLFGTGCQDEQAVRAAVEVSAWAAQVFGRERSYLKRGFEVAYGAELGSKLEEIRYWTKALAYTKRIRNFRVVSPQHLLGLDLADMEGCQLSEYWDADPVHLNEYGYDTLAEAIINETCEESFNRATPTNDGVRGQAAAGRRPAEKWPFERRQSWIMADEAVAIRTDGRAISGGNFRGSSHSYRSRGGQFPWRGRGGRGGRGGSRGERGGKWPRGRQYNKPY
jgi:hypothetical protein